MKLTKSQLKEIIKEASSVSANSVPADDGPTFGMGTFRGYRQINKREAEKLGWEFVNLILSDPPMEEKNQDNLDQKVHGVCYKVSVPLLIKPMCLF